MKTSLFKLTSSVMTLLFVMIIPYFIGLNLMSSQLKTKPQISEQASTSAEVLGISDFPDSTSGFVEKKAFTISPENILISAIGFLGISTIISILSKKLTI